MIDKSSFEKAIVVANNFVCKGLTVVPLEGTPLAHLVNTTNNVGALPPYENSDNYVAGDAVSLSIVSDNDGHSSFYDDYVNTLSTSLSLQINNARNIINPIINEAVERINTSLTLGMTNTYSIELVQVDPPEPLQNISLIEEITGNANGSLLAPRGRITLRNRANIESIVALVVTGSELFDVSIKKWMDNKGETFILDLWKKTFASVHEGQLQTMPDILELFRGPDSLDNALFIYLVVRKLMEDIPEDAGMTLTNWRETVRDYITVSSLIVGRELAIYESKVASKNLVLNYNPNKKVVTVLGKTYRDYINVGGKNEIIFGAIVNNDIPYSIAGINENPEKYLKAWDGYSAINKTALKVKAFTAFKDSCEYVLINQLNSLVEFEEQRLNENSGFKDTVISSYREQVQNLRPVDMENIYQTVMRLVTSGRFPYTDAYRFLDSMNEIAKSNPEMDPREAAAVATIEYISDHMSDQMKLV